MNRLEEIVSLLEEEEVSLEKSVQLYKEAMELVVFCREKLNIVEKEVTLLQKSADGTLIETTFEEQKGEEDGFSENQEGTNHIY